MVLIRTTLLAFLSLSQALALLAIFKRFFSQPTPGWTSLAKNAYGIFLIHETIMVWSQYKLAAYSIPIGIKFILTFVFGFSSAWLLSDLLRRVPGFRRILSPKPVMASHH